jgi:MoaA/NifB/PqqE/SkfB family radical SAM enzyme
MIRRAPGVIPKESFYKSGGSYSLLPFRFERRGDSSCLLVNEAGEFVVLSSEEMQALVNHQLDPRSETYRRLRAKHFVTDGNSSALLDQLASKYRTKKSFLDGFAKLHIFVTTIRCNQSCVYCQVSRRDEHAAGAVMSLESMRRGVDLMLATPARAVTMEFQGGESLLAFDVVREGVTYARAQNEAIGKDIQYVLCTNLATLSDEHLTFLKDHHVQVSASLDGPDSADHLS